jgi:hypothetical protein
LFTISWTLWIGGDLLFFMVLFLLAYYKLEQSGTLLTVEGYSARRLTLDPPVSFGCLQSATSSCLPVLAGVTHLHVD